MINKQGEQMDPDIIKQNQLGSMSLLAAPAAAAVHGTHSRDPSAHSLQVPGKGKNNKGAGRHMRSRSQDGDTEACRSSLEKRILLDKRHNPERSRK